ncbi:hypothetical protein [Streptomyces sp. B1I3]|uniref:hypothetical protein n=1 Tax=Streptomyces sp. B1I3 TaxID=3042264 RepID=UPI002787BD03|nr:hypothetical protein [Streptomyces sp. B1I3]MDQ0791934.1 hypothetical protein [Streptomyces sp. B1I3]
MRAWLLRRAEAATATNLPRLAEELKQQTPHPDVRGSTLLPTPEGLPAVLARIENEWRERERRSGYPEFGRHARANPPYLMRTL